MREGSVQSSRDLLGIKCLSHMGACPISSDDREAWFILKHTLSLPDTEGVESVTAQTRHCYLYACGSGKMKRGLLFFISWGS